MELNTQNMVLITLTDDERKWFGSPECDVVYAGQGQSRPNSQDAQVRINGMWLSLANKYGFDPVSVVQNLDLPRGTFYARKIAKGMVLPLPE